MTTRNHNKMTVPDFERLLDTHGADRTRWPLSCRANAAALADTDPQARRLLAEATALEEVLAHACRVDADDRAMAALADRIMAATHDVPGAGVRRALLVPTLATVADARPIQRDRGVWRGAALLAASLMIGVFVGQTQFAAHAIPAFEALSGVTLGADKMAMLATDLESSEVD